jgi:hypothetical protein
LVVIGAAFVAIQFVPYGWDHSNPAVLEDAPWPSDEARELAVRACYDCHSNESRWPWYSYVAPMSWLVRRDVDEGREAFNFSNWERDGEAAEDAADQIEDGEMPPSRFTIIHRDANLTDEEQATLIAALEQMAENGGDNSGPGSDNSGPGGGDDDSDDDDNSGPGSDNSGRGGGDD